MTTLDRTISQKLTGYIQVFRNAKEIKMYDNQEFFRAMEAMDNKLRLVKKNYNERKEWWIRDWKSPKYPFVNTILSENLIQIFSDILQDQLPDVEKRKDNNLFPDKRGFDVTRRTFYALNSLVDLSDEIATATIKDGWSLLPSLQNILDALKDNAVNNKLSKNDRQFVRSVLVMLYNLVMHDKGEIIHYVREEGLLENVKPYMKCSDGLKMFSFLFLLYVSNEADACTDEETIRYLINTAMAAVKDREKEKNGFKSMELLRAIEKLSALDVDKYILYKIGIVKNMTEILEDSKENAEILICLCILTNIAFADDSKVAEAIYQEVNGLPDVEYEDEEIVKAQQGLRWVLLQKTNKDCKPRPPSRFPSRQPVSQSEDDRSTATTSFPSQEKHVMISYQWDSQEKIRKIKDYLKGNSFKVWYDEENMEGDLMDAMADAVENASVVLICYSRKYKLSRNCRMEAQYAMKLKQEIIPLRMEEYDPDGWLGLMLGTMLYYDFTKRINGQELDKLCTAIVNKRNNISSDEPFQDRAFGSMQDSITPKSARPLTMTDGGVRTDFSIQSTQNKERIEEDTSFLLHWDQDELDKWFSEIDLERSSLGVNTGADVRTLIRMYRNAPSAFYKYMLKKLTLSELTKFIEGSENLLKLPQIDLNC